MSMSEGVQYTVKELIAQLGTTLLDMDRKLDMVMTRMELKAEKAELEQVRALVEGIRLIQAQAAPIDTRAAIDRHLQEPHSVAQRHEERIGSLEKWKYSIPPTIIVTAISAAIAVWRT